MDLEATALRPLAFGEILDVALRIVLKHLRVFLPIALIVMLPVAVLAVLVGLSTTPSEGDIFTRVAAGDEGAFDTEELSTFFAGQGVLILVTLVASIIATGACFKAVVEAYLGGVPDTRDALSYAWHRLHSLVWISLLTAIVTVIGFIFCVAPGVWAFAAFGLATPVFLAEGLRGTKALGRSRALVKGFWWRTFGILFIGSVLAAVIGGIIGAILGAAAGFLDDPSLALTLNTAAGALGSALITPFQAAFTVALYVDLRVRKEAFDLELLAQAIGGNAPVGAVGGILPLPPPPPTRPTDGEQPPYWPPPPGWKPGGGEQ